MTDQSYFRHSRRETVTVTRTYLALASANDLVRVPAASTRAELLPMAAGDLEQWRMLYATVGGPYHWHDRDAWPDEQLVVHLSSPDVRAFSVMVVLPTHTVSDSGLLELQRHEDGRVEIVYLGLRQDVQGRGVGRWLLERAVDEAARLGDGEIWVHTCTLDGPTALPNYLARGFRETRIERYETTI